MAEEKAKVSLTEAIQDLTQFANVFRSAERLKEEFELVTTLEGQISQLRAAIKVLEDEKFLAIKHRDQASKELYMTKESLDVVKRDFRQAIEAEKEGLEQFKRQMAQQTDEIRQAHIAERQRIVDETQALEFKRGNLARDVRNMQERSPEPGIQSRLQNEVK